VRADEEDDTSPVAALSRPHGFSCGGGSRSDAFGSSAECRRALVCSKIQ
jgi:hypothetical protein